METLRFNWEIGEHKFSEPVLFDENVGIYNEASRYILEAIIVFNMEKLNADGDSVNKMRLQRIVEIATILQQLISDIKLCFKKFIGTRDFDIKGNYLGPDISQEIMAKLENINIDNRLSADDLKNIKNIVSIVKDNEPRDYEWLIENDTNEITLLTKSEFNRLINIILENFDGTCRTKYKFLTKVSELVDICYLLDDHDSVLRNKYESKIKYFTRRLQNMYYCFILVNKDLQKIINGIQVIVNRQISFMVRGDGDSDFLLLRDYIFNNACIIKEFKDRYKDGNGCFAILKTDGDSYFAFSGTYEVKENKDIKNNFIKFTSELNNAIFDGKYILSELNDNTISYAELSADYKIIKYSQKPFFYRDIKLYTSDLDIIGSAFGCCERKLLSSINYEIKRCTIYVRWLPCKKCQPALVKYGNQINVYVLSKNCFGKKTVHIEEV